MRSRSPATFCAAPVCEAIGRSQDAIMLLQSEVVHAPGLKPIVRYGRAWSLLLRLQIEQDQVEEAVKTVTAGFPDLDTPLIRAADELDPTTPTLSEAAGGSNPGH